MRVPPAEIPNWAYAKRFVLQDHMFEPVKSWSLPAHLRMVSAWSVGKNQNPMSCVNNIGGARIRGIWSGGRWTRGLTTGAVVDTMLAWTDVTWLPALPIM